jgi:hypothetical protein
MQAGDRRQDWATAEKIEMALKTRRAFDEHTAQRFVELSGIPDGLAQDVLRRPPGQTRSELISRPSPDDARRKRPRVPGEPGANGMFRTGSYSTNARN